MPSSPISAEPQLILEADTQGGASCSESLFAKYGSVSNFILNKFYVMPFGISGAPYSGLSAYPYIFTGAAEAARLKSQIDSIFVFNEVSGISGTTEFRIEKQLAAGGSWANIFTTNCQIQNTANDNISFSNTDLVAPSGVTLPVFPTTTLEVGDKLRFVLVSTADQAQNLKVRVYLRPIN